MTEFLFQESVAIDTNVFVHLLNPERNTDAHINKLLGDLIQRGVEGQALLLIVDGRGRIEREYIRHVKPMLEGQSVRGNELYILTYWMNIDLRFRVPVVDNDLLMIRIKKTIYEASKRADRTFVYVAFKQGKILISNDETDIVYGPEEENNKTPRRDRLLSGARKIAVWWGKHPDFSGSVWGNSRTVTSVSET